MTNVNLYQKAIEQIVMNGYSVIQVFPLGDATAYYYLVHKFQPAMTTPTDDIQYNQLVGINITDFLINTSALDKTLFQHRLNALLDIEDTNVVRMEFPNTIRWVKFGSATK